MGPKLIAIVLVVLIGGVVAYDVKFLMKKESSKQPAMPAEAGEKEAEPQEASDAKADDSSSQGEQEPLDSDPAQQAAVQDKTHISAAGGESGNNLPAIFNAAWPEPFDSGPPGGEPSGSLIPNPQPGWRNPFPDRAPVVSAVLIAGTEKRAIIDRRLVRVGDILAHIEAEVTAISRGGVELKIRGKQRFFPVGEPASGRAPAEEQ